MTSYLIYSLLTVSNAEVKTGEVVGNVETDDIFVTKDVVNNQLKALSADNDKAENDPYEHDDDIFITNDGETN